MSPVLQRLIELQRLETVITESKARMASHPQRLAEADAQLAAATQALDAIKERLKTNQETRRALEKDEALYKGRLSKFRDQQGSVKTNKEYQALGHEIETAQKDLGVVEERMIEQMIAADSIAAEVKQAEAAFAAQRKTIEAQKAELTSELSTLERALAEATAARATVLAQIEPRLISIFEHVAKARKGIAVSAATRDGLCSVCHVRLRPAVFQQVRANEDIVQCDSCQRILYYVPPPPPVEAPVVRTGPA